MVRQSYLGLLHLHQLRAAGIVDVAGNAPILDACDGLAPACTGRQKRLMMMMLNCAGANGLWNRLLTQMGLKGCGVKRLLCKICDGLFNFYGVHRPTGSGLKSPPLCFLPRVDDGHASRFIGCSVTRCHDEAPRRCNGRDIAI